MVGLLQVLHLLPLPSVAVYLGVTLLPLRGPPACLVGPPQVQQQLQQHQRSSSPLLREAAAFLAAAALQQEPATVSLEEGSRRDSLLLLLLLLLLAALTPKETLQDKLQVLYQPLYRVQCGVKEEGGAPYLRGLLQQVYLGAPDQQR